MARITSFCAKALLSGTQRRSEGGGGGLLCAHLFSKCRSCSAELSGAARERWRKRRKRPNFPPWRAGKVSLRSAEPCSILPRELFMPFGNSASIKGSVCSSTRTKSADGPRWGKQTAGAAARVRLRSRSVGPLVREVRTDRKNNSGLTLDQRRAKIQGHRFRGKQNPGACSFACVPMATESFMLSLFCHDLQLADHFCP